MKLGYDTIGSHQKLYEEYVKLGLRAKKLADTLRMIVRYKPKPAKAAEWASDALAEWEGIK